VPDGETTLREGDHIYFVSKRESVNAILTLLGKKESIVERVMVIGEDGWVSGWHRCWKRSI